MNFNSQGRQEVTYDAIVVGSGISGGVAAKELTEKGLKTLVLERGRDVKHGDYPTANLDSWDVPRRGRLSQEEMKKYPKQSRTGYTVTEYTKHWFVNDLENPYLEKKRFDWMRGYHVGGRSLMWGRHCYRWSDLDFEANLRDGHGIDWPIRYKDIEPWYDHVEKYVGIQGMKEGLPQLPDGQFLKPFPLNCVEEHMRTAIKTKLGRTLTIGRTANLTEPINGRGSCLSRNRCIRGCPYGAYFSSNSATLPPAEKTGNLTLRPHSIVNSLIFNPDTRRVEGVRVIDAETQETHEFYSRVVFLCASALGSTFILMNTRDHFAGGLGSSSGELGHNLMDHHFRAGANGTIDGWEDKYYKGRRPPGFYIVRFRNVDKASQMKDFVRGYGYQGSASRENWRRAVAEVSFGADLKAELEQPGTWRAGMTGFGECLPYHENKVTLTDATTDKWGQPVLEFDCEFKENELRMREDMKNSAAEMLEAAGFKNIVTTDNLGAPGLGIHEMGTARMGKSSKTSVLNKFNQVWDAPNVYVTDGACMTSSGCQNPSITYMALTARAVDHAVKELNKQNL